MSSHMRDYEVFYDATVTSEGNFVDYALITEVEPIEFEQVITDKRWQKAMQEEIEFIKKNQTWKLTKLPSNKKPTTLKWIYKSKINPQDIVVR